ncbi:MAG: hypothetical protein H0A75_07345 [Candidatus Methanofishera endochildressiae]|uniref:Uncharacterized protein n=1 Tax=Candidatus Methanofishera endochildressiae TaxID=2738884 RepID=A0A7Z0MQA5_9GAMM|nr:hypothetical protein [Candidatus Methanofishera endochildressiae]
MANIIVFLYKDATAILISGPGPLPALLERRLKVTAKQQALKLKIQLTQFEQQFEAIDSAHVEMAFTVSVFLGDSNSLLAKRSFTLSQQTVSADAEGAIAGFVVLTKQANKEISVWLESLPNPRESLR